jgi:hypothetical protein
MPWIRTNRDDEGTLALLRANDRRPRMRVGADRESGFPTGIFAAIIGAGIVGGLAATYFERMERQGWSR